MATTTFAKCRVCGKETGSKTRGYCSEKCRLAGLSALERARHGRTEMTGPQVDAFLTQKCLDEHELLPWEKHPQPQTGVVVRRIALGIAMTIPVYCQPQGPLPQPWPGGPPQQTGTMGQQPVASPIITVGR